MPWQYHQLSPLARSVFTLLWTNDHITALDAFRALGISSSSMTRRLTDIEKLGVKVKRARAKDPITKRAYTRYSLDRKAA